MCGYVFYSRIVICIAGKGSGADPFEVRGNAWEGDNLECELEDSNEESSAGDFAVPEFLVNRYQLNLFDDPTTAAVEEISVASNNEKDNAPTYKI
ncbi:hypothetical protein FQA39_LY16550 [Lamprigera yunnana]|nr:hypothetical protein FQA39_LY16550 [Lamprigera yunnana]